MYYESEYLQHHGIKGQRWGVRRYQNADGTYTKAGLARYKDRGRRKYIKSLDRGGKVLTRYSHARTIRELDYQINKDTKKNKRY